MMQETPRPIEVGQVFDLIIRDVTHEIRSET
jgi:hypothetical protein